VIREAAARIAAMLLRKAFADTNATAPS